MCRKPTAFAVSPRESGFRQVFRATSKECSMAAPEVEPARHVSAIPAQRCLSERRQNGGLGCSTLISFPPRLLLQAWFLLIRRINSKSIRELAGHQEIKLLVLRPSHYFSSLATAFCPILPGLLGS